MTEEGVKYVFVKLKKSMFFQDPYLIEIERTDPFQWKIYRFQAILIL